MARPKKQVEGLDLESIKQALKAEILEEVKSEGVKAQEALNQRREEETKSRAAYVERMKASAEPWVDIIGLVNTDQGVRTELDWNDAFVVYLKSNGITGVDDEQVVQKWLALLLRDIADDMEGLAKGEAKSEFE